MYQRIPVKPMEEAKTAADAEALIKMMEVMYKAEAIAGKGAEGKRCGPFADSIRCVEGLCCGDFVRTAAEIAKQEAELNKEIVAKMMAMTGKC